VINLVESSQDIKQGRLPATGRPKNTQELARPDNEIEVLEDGVRRAVAGCEALAQGRDGDCRGLAHTATLGRQEKRCRSIGFRMRSSMASMMIVNRSVQART